MSFGVYILRAQPFHNGHLEAIRTALANGIDHLLLLIGSSWVRSDISYLPSGVRNPFDDKDRMGMILESLSDRQLQQITIDFVKDFPTNSMWQYVVNQLVREHNLGKEDVTIFGHIKDETSFYLRCFPKWFPVYTKNYESISGTIIRENFFNNYDPKTLNKLVPKGTYNFLQDYYECRSFSYEKIRKIMKGEEK